MRSVSVAISDFVNFVDLSPTGDLGSKINASDYNLGKWHGVMPRLSQNLSNEPPSLPEKQDLSALLVRVGAQKDRAAFATLFAHFAPRVKSFLMKGRMNADQAEELAQETMLSVWDKALSYDPMQAAASTWIFTIARNKRIDYLRRTIKPTLHPDDLYPNQYEDPASHILEQAQDQARIWDALKKLPVEQAELIKRSFFDDQAHGDIAAATKLPLGTVKSRIRLALERLRKDISPTDHGF